MATEYDYLCKIVMLGNSSVGKTSLHTRITENTFKRQYQCTISVDFRCRVIQLDSTVIKAQVWDTAGAERYRSISRLYYRVTQGIFLVYNVTDRTSFSCVPQWLSEIREFAPKDVVLLLLGNKSDLDTQRVVSFEEGKALADEFEISFMETSAKTSANVEAAFIAMAAEIKARIESNVMSYQAQVRSIQPATEKSGYCS
jgi:Ras-related protein Rab-1A